MSRGASRRLGPALLVAALAALLPAPAAAQLPWLPGLGGDAPRDPPAKAPAEDDGARADPPEEAPRAYAKPTPRPLPEGPAERLVGAVLVVPFKGMVNPGMGEFVASAIRRAERDRLQAVLLELDTPGGLVSTTQAMVQSILAAKVPVIVYVTPSGAHAASAGTFITLAGHIAAMAPATRLGAAHPVTGGGKDPEEAGGEHMGRKVENDLVAFVEGIARERNRNVEWAVDAVRRSVSINSDRALELGVIDLVARDRAELLAALDGRPLLVAGKKVALDTRGAPTLTHEQTLREKLLNMLADPGVAMLLGILGFIGVMVEIYHPGMIAPGVLGVLCVLTSLIAMEQLPIDVGAAILVLAGLALVIAELYTPTHGVLGVLGGLGLVLGLVLLVDTQDPSYLVDDSLRLGLADVLPLALLFFGFVAYLSVFVTRKRHGRPLTGAEALVGQVGAVLQPVGPEGGKVFIAGEYWSARAAEAISAAEQVEVVRVDGLQLEVRRRPPPRS